jgi:hypothetical protein
VEYEKLGERAVDADRMFAAEGRRGLNAYLLLIKHAM